MLRSFYKGHLFCCCYFRGAVAVVFLQCWLMLFLLMVLFYLLLLLLLLLTVSETIIIKCWHNLTWISDYFSGISPVLFREKAELNLISNVLLRNYSKQVLPIVKSNEPVKVTIQLILRRLVQVVCCHYYTSYKVSGLQTCVMEDNMHSFYHVIK